MHTDQQPQNYIHPLTTTHSPPMYQFTYAPHPCTNVPMHHTHAPTHSRPTLLIIPDPNPTSSNIGALKLHYAAATSLA